MLIDDEKLYDALTDALKTHYDSISNMYIFVHAIYEPDDDGGLREGMYHAAADFFREGETFHVYFTVNDDDSITIDLVDRWFMG